MPRGTAETIAQEVEIQSRFAAAIGEFEKTGGGPGAYEALIELDKVEALAREQGVQLPESRLEKVRMWGAHPGVADNLFAGAEDAAKHGDVESTTKFLYLVEQAAHWGQTQLDHDRVRAIKQLLRTKLEDKEFGRLPS